MTMTRQMEAFDIEADKMNSGKSSFFAQVSWGSNTSQASTVHSLEELASPEFFSNQCSEIDEMAARVVCERSIQEAICAAMADVQFCVSIADPRSPDVPLIAVSEKFEAITGYHRSEVLGKNCRFLNTGCSMDPVDLVCLRSACETGSSFTSVVPNRRKTGEFFLNLLDVRGLTVARNPCTGEELWFLVGIQADVTDAVDSDMGGDRLTEMREIASRIRNKLTDEFAAMAVAGALMNNFGVVDLKANTRSQLDAWELLAEPCWRRAAHNSTLPGYFLTRLGLNSFSLPQQPQSPASLSQRKGKDRFVSQKSSAPPRADLDLAGRSCVAKMVTAIVDRLPGGCRGPSYRITQQSACAATTVITCALTVSALRACRQMH